MNESEENPIELTSEEARALGCLLEKAATTPDVYPLTLNSLLAACNQKTNRHPVVEYDEETVAEATEGLRARKLAFRVDVAGSRVPKYRHNVDQHLGLDRAGKALLAVLLLRGPQTPGELRLRTERMHSFATTAAVEQELDELADELDPPLWKKLPPSPGQKEVRYCHLLCGEPAMDAMPARAMPVAPAIAAVQARNERIENLETKVAGLEAEIAMLKESFEQFQKQFD
ncbi:MAG: YceH family protein [Opitutales bacterium]